MVSLLLLYQADYPWQKQSGREIPAMNYSFSATLNPSLTHIDPDIHKK
jgi:hypothetical protein